MKYPLRLALVAIAIAACNSAPGPAVPNGVAVVSGSEQFAVAGSAPANPLVVLVIDSDGNPFANTPVIWKVTSGGGTVADSTSTSDASGHAAMTYTAGSETGVATVTAIVAQVWTAQFNIHIVAPTNRVR
ncbi:MAG TPA: Ig-like domain-containing protein [Gemmatimonadaceae bacterium]